MNVQKVLKKIMIFLGVATLLFFFISFDVTGFTENLTKVTLLAVAIIIVLTLFNIILKAIRWKLLIKKNVNTDVSFGFSFRSILAGVAAGSFIPGRIEMAKPLLLKTEKDIRFSQSLPILFIERVFDLLSIIFILSISLFFVPRIGTINFQIIAFFGLLVTALCLGALFLPHYYTKAVLRITKKLLTSENLNRKIESLCQQFIISTATTRKKEILFFFLLLSLITNLIEVARLLFILSFFNITHSLVITMFLFSFGVMIGIISLIPGGMGITEISTTGILSLLYPTVNLDTIKSAIVIDRFVAYYLLVALGAVILIKYGRGKSYIVSREDS